MISVFFPPPDILSTAQSEGKQNLEEAPRWLAELIMGARWEGGNASGANATFIDLAG